MHLNNLRDKSGIKELPATYDPSNVPIESSSPLELCAGIMDVENSLPSQTAAREVLEECGYAVEHESLISVRVAHTGVGLLGSKMHIFYGEVTESMRVAGAGGGLAEENESIEVIYWPIDHLDELFKPDAPTTVTTSLLFGVYWFITNKLPRT